LGEHLIAESSKKIAKFLKLNKPEEYTSHTYKHSTATLMANSNCSVIQLANAGNRKSEKVAKSYIQDSKPAKRKVAELIGLFNGYLTNKVTTTKENSSQILDVQNAEKKEKKSEAPNAVTVTNIFNFTGFFYYNFFLSSLPFLFSMHFFITYLGDSSSIKIGDFNFAGIMKGTTSERFSNSLILNSRQEQTSSSLDVVNNEDSAGGTVRDDAANIDNSF
jgi:hypothetical protein